MLGNELFIIQVSPSETTYARAIDDDRFQISSAIGILNFTDEELKKDKTGRYMIDISSLRLGNVTEVEVPKYVLEKRAQKRLENAITKGAIEIQDYKGKRLYYYLENEKLIVKMFGVDDAGILKADKPEAEISSEEILVKQGHKVIPADEFKAVFGHEFLIVPPAVLKKWEPILKAKELSKLSLIPAPASLTDDEKYYKLNMEVEPDVFKRVQHLFINWNEDGLVTCRPGEVAKILRIPIE